MSQNIILAQLARPVHGAYFQHRTTLSQKVLEVGTFIGKSTYSMALGSDLSLSKTIIHTCDFSNNISVDLKVG